MAEEHAARDGSEDGARQAGTGTRRRGIKIYSASDAVNNDYTGFRGEGRTTPELTKRMADLGVAGYRLGVQSMCLFRQTEEEGGFSAVLVWGKPNYPLPRHSHMSDCMYFIISGSATMGKRTLRPGDSFFAPDGAPYQWTAGPDGVEVLEVRHNVELIGTDMTETSPDEVERYREVIVANRDRWAAMDVSPTFAANRQG
jgi:mannose-6-phosphate isomerase-like protein (cupin superfamily)